MISVLDKVFEFCPNIERLEVRHKEHGRFQQLKYLDFPSESEHIKLYVDVVFSLHNTFQAVQLVDCMEGDFPTTYTEEYNRLCKLLKDFKSLKTLNIEVLTDQGNLTELEAMFNYLPDTIENPSFKSHTDPSQSVVELGRGGVICDLNSVEPNNSITELSIESFIQDSTTFKYIMRKFSSLKSLCLRVYDNMNDNDNGFMIYKNEGRIISTIVNEKNLESGYSICGIKDTPDLSTFCILDNDTIYEALSTYINLIEEAGEKLESLLVKFLHGLDRDVERQIYDNDELFNYHRGRYLDHNLRCCPKLKELKLSGYKTMGLSHSERFCENQTITALTIGCEHIKSDVLPIISAQFRALNTLTITGGLPVDGNYEDMFTINLPHTSLKTLA
ncbi:MAG: hypothetical protein EXX96DRAFT_536866 [Benjaminiella poitrasii]|nr:MAG: hypothetical protein EXX96DRAFT_536866 [Benjaminiella poitrasii]